MGRFFQQAMPEFIDDNMFNLPAELMQNVLLNKEKAVDDTLAANAALLDKLQAQGLKVDEPRLKEIISGYESRVDEISNKILQDPMNYNNYSESIRQLGRDVNKDWSIGEVAGIQSNRKAYFDWVKTMDEEAKKNPDLYANGQLDALKKKVLTGYGGISYDPDTGGYNTIETEDLAGMQDMTSFLKDVMDNAVQDVNTTVKWDNDKGMYRVKGERSDKYYSEEQLKNLYQNALATTPDILSGLKQRETLSLEGYSGNFDAQGNPILAPGNYLDQGLNYMLNKYGGKETVRESGQTYNKMWEMEYAYGLGKRKEQEDTEYVQYVTKNELTSHAGLTNEEFNTKTNQAFTMIKNSKEEGLQLAMDKFGFKSLADMKAKNPALYNAISKGDFSQISDLPHSKTLAKTLKEGRLQAAALDAYKKDFAVKFPGMTYEQATKDPKTKQAWNNYLADMHAKETTVNATFEDLNLNQKQINEVQDQIFKGEMYQDAVITLPNGFTVNGKNIGGSKMSVNDMIREGILKPKPVKYEVMGKGEKKMIRDSNNLPVKDASGKIMYEDTQEIQYELMDGTGTLNFSSTSKSIAPSLNYNDNGKIPINMKVTIGTQEAIASFDNVTTSSIKEWEQQNRKRLKARLFFQKAGGVRELVIPDSNGAVYHGEDVYGKDSKGKTIKLYSAGTVTIPNPNTGGKETFSINDPDVEKMLGEFLYGDD